MDLNRLKKVRLFAGLSTHELETVASRGTLRKLSKNTVFIEHGDASSSLYLILSGNIKVYLLDVEGHEQVLELRGSGDHLGELALLKDSVRTASAATLEDTDFLVLSRRAFVECLSDCPQIALNLDDSLERQILSLEDDKESATHYRAWSRFRHSGLPLIVLIGGCTGTGKSTVAAELALRLDIGRTQSTDILREIVRLFVHEKFAPELHVSSYEAWQVLFDTYENDRRRGSYLIDGFRAQSNKLTVAIDEVIKRSIKERVSTIIEGIHICPDYQSRVIQEDALVVPILLTIPTQEELKQHFYRRGQLAPSRDATQYLEHLSTIWQVQEYLVGEAKRCGVPIIPNRNLDVTLQGVIRAITKRLTIQFL